MGLHFPYIRRNLYTPFLDWLTVHSFCLVSSSSFHYNIIQRLDILLRATLFATGPTYPTHTQNAHTQNAHKMSLDLHDITLWDVTRDQFSCTGGEVEWSDPVTGAS